MKIFSLVPMPILLLVGILVIIAITIWQSKRKQSNPSQSQSTTDSAIDPIKALFTVGKKNKAVVFCRVLDNITGEIYNAELTRADVTQIITDWHTIGRQYDRDGKKVYGVCKYKDDTDAIKYRPLVMPKQTNQSPTEAHGDIQHGALTLFMTEVLNGDKKPFMQEYGQMIWWVAVIGFLIFMMVSSQA